MNWSQEINDQSDHNEEEKVVLIEGDFHKVR